MPSRWPMEGRRWGFRPRPAPQSCRPVMAWRSVVGTGVLPALRVWSVRRLTRDSMITWLSAPAIRRPSNRWPGFDGEGGRPDGGARRRGRMGEEALRWSEYRSMPWKNGGGTTREVASGAVHAPFASKESEVGFDWRVSVADVDAGDAFST